MQSSFLISYDHGGSGIFDGSYPKKCLLAGYKKSLSHHIDRDPLSVCALWHGIFAKAHRSHCTSHSHLQSLMRASTRVYLNTKQKTEGCCVEENSLNVISLTFWSPLILLSSVTMKAMMTAVTMTTLARCAEHRA